MSGILAAINQKVIFGVIIFLIILIPSASYVISGQIRSTTRQTNPKASTTPKISPREVPKISPTDELKQNSSQKPGSSGTPLESSGSATEVFFGPSLSFSINIQGRPEGKNKAKVFVGIASGNQTTNTTQFLISFVQDVPESGQFIGASLAGLNQGETYTAYIKGPAQIATSSAFTLKPTDNNLGNFNLISGDLNEDNIINQADLDIAKKAYGSTPSSETWNAIADFNLDSIVNLWDLSIIYTNMATTGASGPWYSKITLQQNNNLNQGSPNVSSSSGYWMWIPKLD